MRRRKSLLLTAATCVVGLTVAGIALASAGGGSTTVVKTVGKEYWESNTFVAATLRFAPETITVQSGDSVTFVHADRDPEPHTVTIATRSQLPKSFDSPCKPCQVAGGHLKNPRNEESGVAHWVLNKGPDGFDRFGDSLALAPKGPHRTGTVTISASAGTTLYYICAIHPWMQGKIVVTQ